MIVIAALSATACAPDLTCSEPQKYQFAREGERVVAPEGLDGLVEANEMEIPRASPRDPRPADSPCLDLPPTIQASSDDD